ncbi:hypothetical protein ABBQ32_012126 [Trebouxia sp. C0010 RCD-2024]
MPKSASAFAALQVRTGESSSTVRYLYLKHSESTEGTGTALFVAGLGVSHDEAVLSELFSVFGSVRQVAVHANKTSALIVFKNTISVKKALKTAAEGKSLQFQFSEPTAKFGLKGWVEKHKAKTPGNRALQQQLDEWMEEWEASEKQRHDTAAAAATDEGWTVVTKQRGRRKSTDQSGTSVGSVAATVAAAAQSRKAPKQLLDFYRFQARDRRRNNVMELQQQFEQDKKKIAEWKASRRFKPY